MITLEGQRVFVSGAAAGMGRAIAEQARDLGAHVVATDRDADGLQQFSDISTEVLDVTDTSAVRQFFDEQHAFDALVNTAGWVHHGTVLDTDPADWKASFEINVDSIYHVSRAALPKMIAEGGGTIVNIASIVSSLKGFPFRAAYGTTKAALIGLTKSIAVDFMKDGIRCHAICPSTVRTPSLEGRMSALGEQLGSFEKAEAFFFDRQPMGRIGTAEEQAKLACFLMSDAASFATGQCYIMDGGVLA